MQSAYFNLFFENVVEIVCTLNILYILDSSLTFNPMKKLCLLAMICLPVFLTAQIKELRKGWRLGFGNANYISDNFTKSPAPKLYIQGGGVLVYRMTNWGLIRSDLQFCYSSASGQGITKAGSSWLSSDQPFTDNYKNLSLTLPLAIRIGPPLKKLRPYLEFGAMAQANLLNSEERIYESQSFNDKNGYGPRKMEDASPLCAFALASGGLELHTEEERDYFIEFRYFHPLTDMGMSDNKSITMTGFTIGGGVIF